MVKQTIKFSTAYKKVMTEAFTRVVSRLQDVQDLKTLHEIEDFIEEKLKKA